MGQRNALQTACYLQCSGCAETGIQLNCCPCINKIIRMYHILFYWWRENAVIKRKLNFFLNFNWNINLLDSWQSYLLREHVSTDVHESHQYIIYV